MFCIIVCGVVGDDNLMMITGKTNKPGKLKLFLAHRFTIEPKPNQPTTIIKCQTCFEKYDLRISFFSLLFVLFFSISLWVIFFRSHRFVMFKLRAKSETENQKPNQKNWKTKRKPYLKTKPKPENQISIHPSRIQTNKHYLFIYIAKNLVDIKFQMMIMIIILMMFSFFIFGFLFVYCFCLFFLTFQINKKIKKLPEYRSIDDDVFPVYIFFPGIFPGIKPKRNPFFCCWL